MYTLHTIFLQASSYEQNPGPNPFFIFFAFAVVVFLLLLAFRKTVGEIHSNEVFSFVDFQFSAQDYYSKVQEFVTARNMPDVNFSRVTYSQGGLGKGDREYLRVDRKDDIFDICASPFGNGSFVSYWYGEPKKRLKELAYKIPRVNTFVDAFDKKTRFELDTATVFRTWVKECIDLAIEDITGQKGVRLSPEEVNAQA